MTYFDIPPASSHLFNSLSEEKKQQVYIAYSANKKDPSMSWLFALLGISLFLYGKVGLGVVFVITGGGCGFWWIFELIKSKKRCEDYNAEILNNLIMQVR
jgi:TM2 domain-containing membrane protein YozV